MGMSPDLPGISGGNGGGGGSGAPGISSPGFKQFLDQHISRSGGSPRPGASGGSPAHDDNSHGLDLPSL